MEQGSGDALGEVARIHPLLDRLRDLLVSALALDVMAGTGAYWSSVTEPDAPVRPEAAPGR